MNEKICIVCQDFPAPHIIKLCENDKESIQHLCSEHYQQIDDPKRFFSQLEDTTIPQEEEVFYVELYSD